MLAKQVLSQPNGNGWSFGFWAFVRATRAKELEARIVKCVKLSRVDALERHCLFVEQLGPAARRGNDFHSEIRGRGTGEKLLLLLLHNPYLSDSDTRIGTG